MYMYRTAKADERYPMEDVGDIFMEIRDPRFHDGARKAAVIGAGYVGSTIAYAMVVRDAASEVILIDIDRKKAEGEALDIPHGISDMGTAPVYVGDYSDIKDCDLIIITAGRNRRPGETRLQLVSDNAAIMRDVLTNIQKYYTHGTILVVSNPVDVLTAYTDKIMGLPNGQVFGTGCLLDTSRMIRTLSDYLNVPTPLIKGSIVGEHGDSQIPVWSRFTVCGVPIEKFCEVSGILWNDEKKNEIKTTVTTMGSTIINGKGKTHYGIGTCTCYLADTVLGQKVTVASVSSVLRGEYGISGVALSVPSVIGSNGVSQRIVEEWSDSELAALRQSAARLKETLETIDV